MENMASSSSSSSRTTRGILESIISESINAYNDESEAGNEILQFLINGKDGLTEDSIRLFRQSWTKVILASRAFGQEKKKITVDKNMFAQEFIKELINNDKDYLILQDLLMQLDTVSKVANEREKLLKATGQDKGSELAINREEDFFKSSSILFTLRRLIGTGLELHESALNSNKVDDEMKSFDGYDDRIESIMSYRRSARLVKQKVLQKKPNTSSFLPIDIGKYYGYPEVLYGISELKVDPDQSTLQSSIPSVTFKVSNKQALYQSRGWVIYQFMYEATRAKESNIFPSPIGVVRDPTTMAISYSFENPVCDPLSSMQGPTLSQLLRSNPSIVLKWSHQLGFAYETLQRSSACLIRRVSLKDVYIKKDGRLLIGNLAVSAKPTNRTDNSVENFSIFMIETLSSLLSTSRRCNIKKRGSSDYKEEVISITEGSTVELAFDDFNFQSITIDNSPSYPHSDKGNNNTNEVNNSSLKLTIKGDMEASEGLSVKGNNLGFSSSYSNPSIVIIGKKIGNFSLHSSGDESLLPLSDQSMSSDVEGGGVPQENNMMLPVIRIVVVPKSPIVSVEVQELIACLEESYSTSKPLFLQSRCLQSNSKFVPKDITNDWVKITRTIDEMKIRTRL